MLINVLLLWSGTKYIKISWPSHSECTLWAVAMLHFNHHTCACDVICSFSFSTGGPGPAPALCYRSVYFCRLAATWDFLCVHFGCSTCRQHGPSSLLSVPITGCLVALLPSCRSLAEGIAPCKQARTQKQWFIQVCKKKHGVAAT